MKCILLSAFVCRHTDSQNVLFDTVTEPGLPELYHYPLIHTKALMGSVIHISM